VRYLPTVYFDFPGKQALNCTSARVPMTTTRIVDLADNNTA